jgi:hypothetical protein
MTDREYLELAAMAAGIGWDLYENAWYGVGVRPDWNPLTDDGDALRLAVKCGIFNLDDALFCGDHSIDFQDDPHAATRRAIVRAAAEIGRSME